MIGEYERDVDVDKIKKGDEIKFEENGIQTGIVIKKVVRDNYSRFHVHHKNDEEEIKILPGHKIVEHERKRVLCPRDGCDGKLEGYPIPSSDILACVECGKEFKRDEVE